MLWNPRFVRTRRKSNAFYFGENRCPANFNTQQCSTIMQSQNTLQLSWYVLILWLFLLTLDIKYLDVRSSNFHISSRMSKIKNLEFSILLCSAFNNAVTQNCKEFESKWRDKWDINALLKWITRFLAKWYYWLVKDTLWYIIKWNICRK